MSQLVGMRLGILRIAFNHGIPIKCPQLLSLKKFILVNFAFFVHLACIAFHTNIVIKLVEREVYVSVWALLF